MKMIRLGVLVGLIATMSVACADLASAPPLSMTTTTLTAGWEHHFTVEWAAAEQSQSSRKVTGYVYNRNGESAVNMRMLAQAVDSAGVVVGQRIAYLPGGVGGFGRAYFEVPNLPATAGYRVSVWDYTWLQSIGGDGKF
jgi:ABC-type glycerol-3-phosphate transport system substrate-binding protein